MVGVADVAELPPAWRVTVSVWAADADDAKRCAAAVLNCDPDSDLVKTRNVRRASKGE